PEKFEPYMPARVIPSVIFSPSQFEYAGYAGSMTSWQELGKWQIMLNEGRGVLPEETKLKLRELTKNLPNVEAKAKVLYEYLQNKTRYVSIQRGIGGFQPFDATTVDKTGYGDCKALSNYMVALLKEAGLKGYYTQIYAGDNNRPVPRDFTIDYFNHIIVALPNGKDTLWMECTSQTAPFGYLGKFTGNRYALMITETGGALVRTPRYDQSKNLQTTQANVVLDAQGNAKASIKSTYTGLQFENGNLDYYTNLSAEEQRKWLEKNIHIPSFEIATFNMQARKEKIPTAEVLLELNLNRYSSVSGKRLFLTPNLMNRSSYVPEKLEKRKYIVSRTLPYIDIDSITYSIPDVLYPELTPQPIKISSRFGEYESMVKFDQGKLTYVRRLKMNSGEFPAESYNELIDFYKTINKADNLKLVFLNKT
ncbi:MAG: transglutaminase-like domain-containing protein, partial [Cytophagales bacterium]